MLKLLDAASLLHAQYVQCEAYYEGMKLMSVVLIVQRTIFRVE